MLYDLIVVPQEHKCVECGKMLGNNKRRLLHFGVHHAHVLPLVSSHLRSLGPQEEEREEDGFEVTLDPVVDSPVKAKEPKVVKETKIIRKARKKNKGKTEKVVPPIWESTKVVDRLKYQMADEQETLGVQDWPPGWEPRYKVSETVTPEVWSLEEEIEELVYGHATLEEVAFEWGKFNRPVR